MRYFIAYIILCVSACTAYCGAFDSPFGRVPTVSPREARAIADAQKADAPDTERILAEACENKWAGAAVWFNLGNARMELGKTDSAIVAYGKSIELLPSFFAAQKNLAFALLKKDGDAAALGEMKKALALSGGSDVQILLWLASYRAKLRDWSGALASCNQALAYSPDGLASNSSTLQAKAVFLCELGNYAECETLCLQILEKNSGDVSAQKILAKSRAKRGDVKSAISALEILKRGGNASKSEISFLADLYFQKGFYRAAAENYLAAGSQKSVQNVALAALFSGDFKAARACADASGKPFAFKVRGIADVMEHTDFHRAAECLEKYLAAVPDDSCAAFYLGEARLGRGEYEAALSAYARASVDSKFSLSCECAELKILALRGDWRSALVVARKIRKRADNPNLKDYVLRLEKFCAEMD